jgi:Uma2 family endonuclease
MPVAEKRLTWDDIKDWPVDVSQRTELFDGRLEVSPTPGSAHGMAGSDLGGILWNHVRERRLGRLFTAPIDVVLAPDCVCQPDLCFVRAERLNIIKPTYIAGPPDVCIEILSPSSRKRDEVTKYSRYVRYGVPGYWIVDLRKRRIRVYEAVDGRYALLNDASEGDQVLSRGFPDLRLDPAEVFAAI